jgi:hypothetical protein
MARTCIRQDEQIAQSDTYNDGIAPSLANFQTNAGNIQDDLNSIRSDLSYLKDQQVGNWYDTLLSPTTFESGTTRGVDNLNQDLHDLERKRILRYSTALTDITVPNTQNYVVIGSGALPGNVIAAIGTVTTLGTVVATNATFGAHSLAAVGGASTISPKNLVGVVDGSTRDPILDASGRRIYGLAQSESATNGSTITITTPNRVQVSFVVLSATGDSLIACAASDIQNKTVNIHWVERVYLLGLTEQDFLRGAAVDVPSSTTVSRQVAYDNQGTTPVELTTHASLDLNAAGVYWEIRDLANATLLRVTEGSTGGTTVLQVASDVDTFDVNAIVNDFNAGIHARTGGTRPIDIGINDGVIESTAGDLRILGAGELYLDDGNQTGSTWAQTSGIKLSDTTAEWDTFETNFGEVSLLNAINQAYNSTTHNKVYAVVTANVLANVDVSGPTTDNNLDVDLGNLSVGSFINDYDLYLNGVLLRAGANAAANHDYYPGTSLALGQLKFEFALKGTGTKPDQLTLVKYR